MLGVACRTGQDRASGQAQGQGTMHRDRDIETGTRDANHYRMRQLFSFFISLCQQGYCDDFFSKVFF